MGWRWWRTAPEQVAAFVRDRTPLPDEQFVAACGLPNTAAAARVALAVKRSVASYGMAGAEFIRAGDRYPDELAALPGWDSLDFLGWLLELERELDDVVEGEAFDRLPSSFSVKDLVCALYAYQQARSHAAQGTSLGANVPNIPQRRLSQRLRMV